MMKLIAVMAATFVVMGPPAVAQDRSTLQAMAVGDLAGAEERLLAERRVYPDRLEVILNLASVYRRTGRVAEARALYQVILERDAVAMDLTSGAVVSSHDIASAGLKRMTGAQVATR